MSGGPFDRLRANGFAERACGGEGLVVGAPHPAPLDTGFRRYDGSKGFVVVQVVLRLWREG